MNINLHEPYHISERGSDVAHNEITRLLTLARYHVVGHHISLCSVDAEGESHVLLADASSAMRQLDKLSHLTLILMNISVDLSTYATKDALAQVKGSVDNLLLGAVYGGIAARTTNPGTPKTKVFYLPTEVGEYPNFGNLSVAENEIAFLYFDGTNWSKQSVDFSSTITEIEEKANNASTDASNALKKAEAAGKASATNKQNLDNAVERIGTLEDSVNTINTNMPKMICMTETAYEALEKKEADTYYMLTEE